MTAPVTLPGRGVRVVSYNLRDLLDDAFAAARIVRALDPDVLLAQELPRGRVRRHAVRAFAAASGLWWAGAHVGSGGTSVLTAPGVRVEVLEHRGLPVPWLQRERGYALARLAVPGVDGRDLRLLAVSVHLGLSPDQRQDHARRILGALSPDPAAHEADGIVLGGDFNEDARGPARRLLSARLPHVSAEVATYPARGARRAIDAVLAAGNLTVRGSAADAVAGVRPADLRAATDHLPVVVDLRRGH